MTLLVTFRRPDSNVEEVMATPLIHFHSVMDEFCGTKEAPRRFAVDRSQVTCPDCLDWEDSMEPRMSPCFRRFGDWCEACDRDDIQNCTGVVDDLAQHHPELR